MSTANPTAAAVVLLCVSVWSSPLLAQWKSPTSKDQMTGAVEGYAVSEDATPTEAMGFPYQGVRAWLGVGCDGADEWAYVGFSDAPNLTNTVTLDGYHRVGTRIKWDDTVENVTLTQEWGASVLHLPDDAAVIRKLAGSNTVLLELPWYGEGRVYFQFSLNGSTAALSEMRKTCEPARQQVLAQQKRTQAEQEVRAAEARALAVIQQEYYAEVYAKVLAACTAGNYCESMAKNQLNRGSDGYIIAEPYRSEHRAYVAQRRK